MKDALAQQQVEEDRRKVGLLMQTETARLQAESEAVALATAAQTARQVEEDRMKVNAFLLTKTKQHEADVAAAAGAAAAERKHQDNRAEAAADAALLRHLVEPQEAAQQIAILNAERMRVLDEAAA